MLLKCWPFGKIVYFLLKDKVVTMFLISLRQSISDEFLSFIFQVPRTTFLNWKLKLLSGFYSYFLEKLAIPDLEERQKNSISFYKHIVSMIVDGVEQEIVMKTNKTVAQQTRSGKKQKYTVTKLVGVSPQGKLMFFSRSYRGARNDMNVASEEFTVEMVQKLFDPSETIAGDPAFIGLENVWKIPVICPYKKPKNGELQEFQVEWNSKFKSFRTVVENYFAQIKKFKILHHRLH